VNGFDPADLTQDAFLGGRVSLFQPRKGYRAGIDPVLLAASVPAHANQTVLELGCGAGAAILCLAARVPALRLTGVELQSEYADLARRNAVTNNVNLNVYEADLAALPDELRQLQYNHVIANPPYFRAGAHSLAEDAGRRIALGGETALSDWIEVAARRLAPKGYAHFIQRTERLSEVLVACSGRLGSVEVLPFSARAGREPELVIVRARKNGRAAFRLHAPRILHAGSVHDSSASSYSADIEAVLRDGAALEWG
jgi:tRNA1(Val) A37 N6-methylase TrmN6